MKRALFISTRNPFSRRYSGDIIGSKDVINTTMINRSQWTGFEGAPWSHTICLNTPLINESLGFGLSFSNDRIGPTVLNNLTLDLAYHLDLFSDHKLSMGVKVGGNHSRFDLNTLELDNQIDNSFMINNGSGLPLPKGCNCSIQLIKSRLRSFEVIKESK